MDSTQRIVINTAAQYTRTIVNIVLSLYSSRLILMAMGQSDFGIYSLIGGLITMLSFITNALVVTTQRYLSFYHGRGKAEDIHRCFGNSLLLHLVIGGALLVGILALQPYLVHHFLNIDPERLIAADWVYIATAVMLFLAFLTAPYRALFIARENIVFISVVDIADGVFKLLLAILLTYLANADNLILFAIGMTGISLFNLLVLGIHAHRHFAECHIPAWHEWDSHYMRELTGFATWTIYSTGCIIARTQGLALILNRFLGTIINAAYGIAQQVAGAVQFLTQAISNAMSPQIVKAESLHQREQMLHLSEMLSKYATLMMATVSLPLILEMPAILTFWLKEFPDGSVLFCQAILLAAVCDQITIGLGVANQAVGNIRNYSLIVNTTKVLTLPAVIICLMSGLDLRSVMACYIGFELLCALIRIPFLRQTAGLSVRHFVRHAMLPCILPIAVSVATGYACITWLEFPFRFLATFAICSIATLPVIWFAGMSHSEREAALNLLKRKS